MKKAIQSKNKGPFKNAKFAARRQTNYLLFEHIPRKILTFEVDQSVTWNHLFSGFLPKQVRALPAIIVISGCII